MATTYTDQQAAIDLITNTNINTNGTGAITGAVHNLNEIEQNLTMFTNLVAYDNYNYKVVRTNGIPNDNGQELRDAYADAATSPGLSATNRFAILLPPGVYALGANGLDVDTDYVDIIGLGHASDVVITSVSNTNTGSGTIIQTADDVRYKNLTIENAATTFTGSPLTDDCGYAPQGAYPNTVMEDIIFLSPDITGAPFMLPEQTYAGTYVRCKGIDTNGISVMFGEATGSFTECETEWVGGFGFGLPASGTFTDCSALSGFGVNGDATGTFTRCKASGAGFGSGTGLVVSGTFSDCVSGAQSFGYGSTATGKFYNCRSGIASFGASSSAAVYENCVAGQQSFGFLTGATLAGSYSNCAAGNSSFGGVANSILSGTFSNCTAGTQSFGVGDNVQLTGTFNFCTAGINSFGYINPTPGMTGPVMSGTFNSCVAGSRSFGSSSDSDAIVSVSGKFYNCTAGERSFGYIAAFAAGTEFHNCVSNGTSSWLAHHPSGQAYGTYKNCTSGSNSFTMRSRPEASFVNCTAGSESFGVGMTSPPDNHDLELEGTYINCHAGDNSFGYTLAGSADTVILSGRFENCTAGDNSFGYATGNLTDIDASGTFVNCRAGERSFVSKSASSSGPDSFASGYFEGCFAGNASFAGHPDCKKTGTFVRCRLVSDTNDGPLAGPTGYMEDCYWEVTFAAKPALLIEGDGTKIYGGIYKAGAGASDSISVTPALSTYNADIVGIKANGIISGSITNDATAGSLDTEGNFIYTGL